MQTPLRSNKDKRNHPENTEFDSQDKRRKSNNKENNRNSTPKTANKQNLKKDQLEELIQAPANGDSSKIEIENRTQLQTKTKQIFHFKETSTNMMGYITSFLSISDCFNFIKLDKRTRNLILTKHNFFPLFIKIKKMKLLSFEQLFTKTQSRYKDCSEFDVIKKVLIKDQLNEKETEILFREILYSITKTKKISIANNNENLMKYLKLLLTHPKCKISDFQCNLPTRKIYSDLDDILTSNSSIKFLDLLEFEFTSKNVNKLKLPIENNKNLIRIIVSSVNLSFSNDQDAYVSFKLFLDIFQNNSSIVFLYLASLTIDEKLGLIISDFIRDNKTLKLLEFRECKFKIKTDTLNDTFQQNDKLQGLSFFECTFEENSLENIAEALTMKKTNQEKLSLPVVSKLKNISFIDCHLKSHEIEMVAKIVDENTNIENLDISFNKLAGSSIPCILSLIENNKNLQMLNLCYAELEDNDFQSICKALKHNKTMKSVNLNDNECSCSYNEIAELFEANRTLNEFLINSIYLDFETERLIKEVMLERKINALKK